MPPGKKTLKQKCEAQEVCAFSCISILVPFSCIFFYGCSKINLTPFANTNFPIHLLLSLISDTHHLFIKATFAWMHYLALESLNRLCSLLHSCPSAFHKLIKKLLVPVDFSDAPPLLGKIYSQRRIHKVPAHFVCLLSIQLCLCPELLHPHVDVSMHV